MNNIVRRFLVILVIITVIASVALYIPSGITDTSETKRVYVLEEPIKSVEIGADSGGGIHVAWTLEDSLHYARLNGEGATISNRVIAEGDYRGYHNLNLLVDSEDGIHILWVQRSSLMHTRLNSVGDMEIIPHVIEELSPDDINYISITDDDIIYCYHRGYQERDSRAIAVNTQGEILPPSTIETVKYHFWWEEHEWDEVNLTWDIHPSYRYVGEAADGRYLPMNSWMYFDQNNTMVSLWARDNHTIYLRTAGNGTFEDKKYIEFYKLPDHRFYLKDQDNDIYIINMEDGGVKFLKMNFLGNIIEQKVIEGIFHNVSSAHYEILNEAHTDSHSDGFMGSDGLIYIGSRVESHPDPRTWITVMVVDGGGNLTLSPVLIPHMVDWDEEVDWEKICFNVINAVIIISLIILVILVIRTERKKSEKK